MTILETIEAGPITLHRWTADLAGDRHRAVLQSIPELACFMLWATRDDDLDAAQDYLRLSASEWERAETFNFAMLTPQREVVGSCGLMSRRGPALYEIGDAPAAGIAAPVRVDARRGHQRQYPVAVNPGPLIASIPVVVALGLAALALVVAVRAHRRISAAQARYRGLLDARERDLVAVVSHQTSKITRLHEDVQEVRAQVSRTADDVGQSLRHVALVRYDAFGDLSGQLSFAAAILDDHGDGLVISSVHALGESRTYAKDVIEGLCHTTLTHEEQQALAAAHTGKVLL